MGWVFGWRVGTLLGFEASAVSPPGGGGVWGFCFSASGRVRLMFGWVRRRVWVLFENCIVDASIFVVFVCFGIFLVTSY